MTLSLSSSRVRRCGLWLAALSSWATLGLVLAAAPASAQPDHLEVRQLVGGHSVAIAGPLFADLTLSPGQPVVRRLRITSGVGAPVDISLQTTGVSQSENGCTETEVEGGDQTCGAAQGELQDELHMTVRSAGEVRYDGPLSQFEELQIADSRRTARSTDISISMLLPEEAAGIVQSDSVRFDLRWRLTGRNGSEIATLTTAGFGTDGANSTVQVAQSVWASLTTGAALLALAALLLRTNSRRRVAARDR